MAITQPRNQTIDNIKKFISVKNLSQKDTKYDIIKKSSKVKLYFSFIFI